MNKEKFGKHLSEYLAAERSGVGAGQYMLNLLGTIGKYEVNKGALKKLHFTSQHLEHNRYLINDSNNFSLHE